jgi:predicted PurR-regulated permease PerM
MTTPPHGEDHASTPPEAVVGRARGAVYLCPEHLYKAVALFFLLAFLYRFFPQISNGLLLLYAAAIFAVLLNAIVEPFPMQRKWVAALVGLLTVAGIGLLLWIGVPALFSQVRNLGARIPEFQSQLRQWEEWIRQRTGMNVPLVGPEVEKRLREMFQSTAGGDVIGNARSVLELLFVPILILFGGLFAVANPNERLLSPILRATPRDLRPAVRRIFELLGVRIMGWLKGTLIAMLAVGVLSFVALYLIGVPNALLLAVLSGVTEFIPLVGPWIGGAVATLVALLDDPTKALWVALAMLAIQQIESNIITPWAMSAAADVHPFVTLFALVFFGSLFGFLGILLAIPLVLLFWTLVEVLWVERAIDTDEDRITPVVEE